MFISNIRKNSKSLKLAPSRNNDLSVFYQPTFLGLQRPRSTNKLSNIHSYSC